MNISENYKLTYLKKKPPIPSGLDVIPYSIIGKIKSVKFNRIKYLKKARQIYNQSLSLKDCSDFSLQAQLFAFKEIFRLNHKIGSVDIDQSLSLIQEAIFRIFKFRPFVEQIAGALALYNDYIIEMSTGEGKTITAAMTAILRGWTRKPCHVITANDYLANRDANIMKDLFHFCGVTVGSVTSEMSPKDRRMAYHQDVTYSTAKEILGDFLKDRISLGNKQNFQKRIIAEICEDFNIEKLNLMQRGLHTAIIDEADNVLIDEAVTPLIISKEQPNPSFQKACALSTEIAQKLQLDIHYKKNELFKNITFIKDFEEEFKQNNNESSPYFGSFFLKELVRKAIIAKEFYKINHQYVIEEGKIIIVDESTGRKMPMRSWNEGLHQMVELKEGLEMTPMKETQARLSFQNFFRLYEFFSGMTGTGKEATSEFWIIYGVPTMIIPNHKKSQRKIFPLKVFRSKEEKIQAIMKELKKIHDLGRPILIGTRNVAESENISDLLQKMNLPHRVINAVRSEEEAAIIAEAGKKNSITVATNMAGRGTDIKISKESKRLGGLHVIATECHRSSRIDRQLFGRCARQGDPGTASSYASFEDELLVQNIQPYFLPFLKRLGKLAIKFAQYQAHRKDYSSRLNVQKTDKWINQSLSFSNEDVI